MGIRDTILDGLRAVKNAERGLERGLRRAVKGPTPPPPEPVDPYIHPWSTQDLGSPTIVDQMAREHCCGCGSCLNICPVDAISMVEDHEGFYFPVVDHDACIECGKCIKHCPAYCDLPENIAIETCFATIAADDDMRAASSSGGLFSQIADYAFERGGVVYGAAYDGPDTVCHKAVERREDIDILRRSKYVQCSTGTTYAEVKQHLDNGRFVLYSGCPCHVAGLYAYLGGTHENLLTVDLICHGSPSPGLFRRYLKEDYGEGVVREVNFRDKSTFGWSTHMNAYLEDGTCHREVCGKDPYYLMFLRCLAMRPFCSICKFTRLPRVADISIGDWWGIEKFDRSLNDGKGTSLLMLNNERAVEVFEAILPGMARCEEFDLDQARPRNYTIDKPFAAHTGRDRFFELLKFQPFDRAVDYALNWRFDVGIFGLWYGENYGSMLTYYGLRKIVESMGLSTVMIENPLGGPAGFSREPHQFAYRQGYRITRQRGLGQMSELSEICDSFLLGSDQLWNPGLSRPYGFSYFLSFAGDANKRIAYGTSFGKDTHELGGTYLNRSKHELAKFDAVSVRDTFSKDLLMNTYDGIESQKVLDPAILCPPEHYAELASQATPIRLVGGGEYDTSSRNYVFVYILDPTKDTAESLARIAEITGKDVLVSLDYSPTRRKRLFDLFRKEVEPEQVEQPEDGLDAGSIDADGGAELADGGKAADARVAQGNTKSASAIKTAQAVGEGGQGAAEGGEDGAQDMEPPAPPKPVYEMIYEDRGVYVIDAPRCEQWLRAIQDSDCVLTDSFHGSIFAYVFKRDFVSIPNHGRGHKRFIDLLEMLGLQDRMLDTYIGNEDAVCTLLANPVDYQASDALLAVQQEHSMAWLKDALFSPKKVKTERAYAREEVPQSHDFSPTTMES